MEAPIADRENLVSPERADSHIVPAVRRPQRVVTLLAQIGLRRYTGVVLWAILIVTFGVWVPHTFLTRLTITSILSSQALTAVLALAVMFPLIAGVFDLSAAQNLGTSALFAGYLMANKHVSPLVAIVATLLMGLLIGIGNGVLVALVGVDSFIATLGTSSLLLAVTEQLANGRYVGPFPASFTRITAPAPFGIPIIAVYLAVLAIVAWYVLEHTPLGRRMYATGANREAARLAGVATVRLIFWSMVICGVGASLAGLMLASTTNSVNQTLGPQYLLPAYAAAFLGTTQIKLGRFNVPGTVLAIFVLGTGVEGLELVGSGQLYISDYFNGVALVGAVTMAVLVEKNRGRRERNRQLKARSGM